MDCQRGNIVVGVIVGAIIFISIGVALAQSFGLVSSFIHGTPKSEVVEPSIINQSSRMYRSPDNHYILLADYEENNLGKTHCTTRLFDRNGVQLREVTSLLHLKCTQGQEVSIEGFKGFAEDSLVFEQNAGKVTIISLRDNSKKEFSYDTNKAAFIGTSWDLHYQLFGVMGYKFINQIRDTNGKVVKDLSGDFSEDRNFVVESNYDALNNGVLYIMTNYKVTNSSQGYDFQFLDLNSLQLHKLSHMPQDLNAAGRGCDGNWIESSEKGKITLHAGCLNIAKPYKKTDQTVEITL